MRKHKGFTIIELILAMGFLGTLLITIALLVNLITGIYQKGLSLRAVNANGKQIIDDMSRVVGGSPIQIGINPVPNASGNIGNNEIAAALNKYFFTLPRPTIDSQPPQLRGVFCTGMYSYIWNTQPSYFTWRESGGTNVSDVFQLRFAGDSGDKVGVYKMARVLDTDRSVCSNVVANPSRGIIDVLGEPIELINNDESDLIIYDFSVFPASQHDITGQTFYSATFILATMRGGINIMSSGDYCDVEGRTADSGSIFGLTSDFNYCAVNKFNFAMRATGFTEGEDQYGSRRE
ncbi:prepilin-type N-terminal cleavage/methylation domain-containing protein [Candidatus Saccharibacteria bacterium]|nr:prepilin-type N-terminal cleavage/methylation domain-containing protein [Candidatus Saccharibacteria bacterium]